VAHMIQGRKVYKDLVGKPKGKDHLEDQGTDGMGSKWILWRLAGGGGGGGLDSPGAG
jgi:hypothetical protein